MTWFDVGITLNQINSKTPSEIASLLGIATTQASSAGPITQDEKTNLLNVAHNLMGQVFASLELLVTDPVVTVSLLNQLNAVMRIINNASIAPLTVSEPIYGSNWEGGGNPATVAPPNSGYYWTANHDARILEANSAHLSLDDILGLTILFNMRNSEGRSFLRDCFKKYMDVIQASIGHLAQASMGNALTAYGSHIQMANIFEHNGITAAGSAGSFETGFGIETGVVNAGGFLGQILGKGLDVNQTLILAGVGVPEGTTINERSELLRATRGYGESRRPATSKKVIDVEPHAKASEV